MFVEGHLTDCAPITGISFVLAETVASSTDMLVRTICECPCAFQLKNLDVYALGMDKKM